jgi:2-keto-4-pentenoate hydratase/2-oxohepta-3-ene-1,7-dioic acid hydratase in catechol pathway
MRLVTYYFRGQVRSGAMLDDHHVVDLQRADPALPPDLLQALQGEDDAARRIGQAVIEGRSRNATDPDGARDAGLIVRTDEPGFRFEAPLSRPGKALAIGLNYRAHAAETGAQLPEYPIVFTKLATALTGPGRPVEVPKASTLVDWEGELVVVIGRRGRHIAASDALDYVLGYMNGNDVSVRDFQRHTPTWTMGKNFDTHAPTGPWILTTDEAGDPSGFTLRTWVNDVLKQESSTGDLIFTVPELIEYISTAMTLEPGDLIFTGTPSGVGQARNPREWLAPGDTVRVEITGLGSLVNPVVAEV